MAFEKALFRAHPEFASGRLEAEPISKHYMLVRAIPDVDEEMSADPVVGAYLEFLSEQMQARPDLIKGLSSIDRAQALVGDLVVDPDEDLGDDLTLD
jgi:hypothetical protein